jgi:septum formation protein
MWNTDYRLVLASNSKARRRILEDAGLGFEVDGCHLNERQLEREYLQAGGAPALLPLTLARAKAECVSRRRIGDICFGADQILTLDEQVFHKPRNLSDAINLIERLSGRTHKLTSAIAIAVDGATVHEDLDSAMLTMREIDRDRIELYIRAAGVDILNSVGAYQLEKLGVHLFVRVEGDHSTVQGLPILKLLAWLRQKGILLL